MSGRVLPTAKAPGTDVVIYGGHTTRIGKSPDREIQHPIGEITCCNIP